MNFRWTVKSAKVTRSLLFPFERDQLSALLRDFTNESRSFRAIYLRKLALNTGEREYVYSVLDLLTHPLYFDRTANRGRSNRNNFLIG